MILCEYFYGKRDAIVWASKLHDPTARSIWEQCHRADWMMYGLATAVFGTKDGSPEHRRMTLGAHLCASRVVGLIPSPIKARALLDRTYAWALGGSARFTEQETYLDADRPEPRYVENARWSAMYAAECALCQYSDSHISRSAYAIDRAVEAAAFAPNPVATDVLLLELADALRSKISAPWEAA